MMARFPLFSFSSKWAALSANSWRRVLDLRLFRTTRRCPLLIFVTARKPKISPHEEWIVGNVSMAQ